MLNVTYCLCTEEEKKELLKIVDSKLLFDQQNLTIFSHYQAPFIGKKGEIKDEKWVNEQIMKIKRSATLMRLIKDNADFLFQQTEEDCDPDNDFTPLEEMTKDTVLK